MDTTTTTTQSLKKIAITASVAVLINIGMAAQPNQNSNKADLTSSARLEKLMNSTEQTSKYIAQDGETKDALQNLEMLAVNTEKEMQYIAPDDNVEAAIQYLDILAESTESEMQYKVPEENEKLTSLSEKRVRSVNERHSRPLQVETYHSMQEAWLINAGYYKSSRTPAWNKVKRALKAKPSGSEYADKE